MFFLLYKLYFLSPYTNPAPNPAAHTRLQAFLDSQNPPFRVISKLVSSWGPNNVPTRSEFTSITVLVETFGPINTVNTRYTHTNTHVHGTFLKSTRFQTEWLQLFGCRRHEDELYKYTACLTQKRICWYKHRTLTYLRLVSTIKTLVVSSHLYLYSILYSTDCIEAAL